VDELGDDRRQVEVDRRQEEVVEVDRRQDRQLELGDDRRQVEVDEHQLATELVKIDLVLLVSASVLSSSCVPSIAAEKRRPAIASRQATSERPAEEAWLLQATIAERVPGIDHEVSQSQPQLQREQILLGPPAAAASMS